MTSPTSRTLKSLRDMGYIAEVVEHWNQYSKTRHDFLNFADILAIHPDRIGVLAIQCTSDSNVSARIQKMREIEAVKVWLKAGNKLWVVGWGKHGERGKVKHWRMRTVNIICGDEMGNIIAQEVHDDIA